MAARLTRGRAHPHRTLGATYYLLKAWNQPRPIELIGSGRNVPPSSVPHPLSLTAHNKNDGGEAHFRAEPEGPQGEPEGPLPWRARRARARSCGPLSEPKAPLAERRWNQTNCLPLTWLYAEFYWCWKALLPLVIMLILSLPLVIILILSGQGVYLFTVTFMPPAAVPDSLILQPASNEEFLPDLAPTATGAFLSSRKRSVTFVSLATGWE